MEWLLASESSARVVPISAADGMPCSAGLLEHTLRFYPRDTQTSGLFIAKLIKTTVGRPTVQTSQQLVSPQQKPNG